MAHVKIALSVAVRRGRRARKHASDDAGRDNGLVH
jgi:hypothetical protein